MTQVPVNDYYEMTQKFWKQEQEILQKVREQSNAFAYNYVWAELEGMYLSNLTKYPYIVSDVNRKNWRNVFPQATGTSSTATPSRKTRHR